KTFCGDDTFDLGRLTKDLGDEWEVRRIATKPAYSSMAGTHTAIEAALKIRGSSCFDVHNIREVRIGLPEAMMYHGGFPIERPLSLTGAQMSYRYAVAVTFLDGVPSIPQFSSERIDRDDVWELIPRITMYRDTQLDAQGEMARWGAHLTVLF